MAQKNARHVSLVDQNEAPSSRLKSTPFLLGLVTCLWEYVCLHCRHLYVRLRVSVRTSNRSPKSRRNTSRCATRHKVPLFSVVAEVLELRESSVESKRAGLTLLQA